MKSEKLLYQVIGARIGTDRKLLVTNLFQNSYTSLELFDDKRELIAIDIEYISLFLEQNKKEFRPEFQLFGYKMIYQSVEYIVEVLFDHSSEQEKIRVIYPNGNSVTPSLDFYEKIIKHHKDFLGKRFEELMESSVDLQFEYALKS